MSSKLSFIRKIQKKDVAICSEDRPYIDFLINDIPLSDVLGGVGKNIGKFGWKGAISRDRKLLKALAHADSSHLPNQLFPIYVCAECGDEGCGAVMLKKRITEQNIIWYDFVWSDGDDEGDQISSPELVFDKQEYFGSMERLASML